MEQTSLEFLLARLERLSHPACAEASNLIRRALLTPLRFELPDAEQALCHAVWGELDSAADDVEGDLAMEIEALCCEMAGRVYTARLHVDGGPTMKHSKTVGGVTEEEALAAKHTTWPGVPFLDAIGRQMQSLHGSRWEGDGAGWWESTGPYERAVWLKRAGSPVPLDAWIVCQGYLGGTQDGLSANAARAADAQLF